MRKAPNAEALVDKAISRVYEGTEEDRSLDSTEHEMKLINGVLNVLKMPPIPRSSPATPVHSQQQPSSVSQQPSQLSPPSVNQNNPQGNTSQQPPQPTGSDVPKQTIMRPSFYGNNTTQPNGPSVPRPPLVTPALPRTSSGSTQNVPARPNTASSSSTLSNISNPPQAASSSFNRTGTVQPSSNVANRIAQAAEQNGASNGLKIGETLTEAGFVRSFPHPKVST